MPAGRGTSKMRSLGIVALGAALSGCAFQRAEVAQQAQANMIGISPTRHRAVSLRLPVTLLRPPNGLLRYAVSA